MLKCILIPAYNVREHIEELVQNCTSKAHLVLIVDDGSTDGTDEQLRLLKSRNHNLCVLRNDENRGKAEAIIRGLQFLYDERKDIELIIQMDADLAHSPSDITPIVSAFVDAHMVVGNRYFNRSVDSHRRCVMHLASQLIEEATGFRLDDPMCGFRAYSNEVAYSFLSKLSSHGYGIETEQLILCRLNNYTVKQCNLTRVVPQDIKTKAIEFIDVFSAIKKYAEELGLSKALSEKLDASISRLSSRSNFKYQAGNEILSFEYVPYGDSYKLEST